MRAMADKFVTLIREGADGTKSVSDLANILLEAFEGEGKFEGNSSSDEGFVDLQKQVVLVCKSLNAVSPESSTRKADGDAVRELQRSEAGGGATSLTGIVLASLQGSKFWQVPWQTVLRLESLSPLP